MLHGGRDGYGTRHWRILERSTSAVTLGLADPDGSMGFPGTVNATCRYSLVAGPALRTDPGADTDMPTPVNLGHHSYFHLDMSGDVRNQMLRLDASRYLPADDDNLPTGIVAKVDSTSFDFREERPIGSAFDHNFALRKRAGLRFPLPGRPRRPVASR